MVATEGLRLCSQLKLQYKIKKDLKASRKDLGSFYAQYDIEMSLPPSQKNNRPYYSSKRKSYSKQKYPKMNDRKHKSHKYKSHKYKFQNLNKPHKREIKCFKCGKTGHIAPNCRKQKINVLSDSDRDYYSSEESTSSSYDISQNENSIPEKEKDSTDKVEIFL